LFQGWGLQPHPKGSPPSFVLRPSPSVLAFASTLVRQNPFLLLFLFPLLLAASTAPPGLHSFPPPSPEPFSFFLASRKGPAKCSFASSTTRPPQTYPPPAPPGPGPLLSLLPVFCVCPRREVAGGFGQVEGFGFS